MLLSHNGLCCWDRSYGNGTGTGEIPEVADIPEGSIVNVFSNNGMQGEGPILRGAVGSDGRFTISGLEPLLISNVTVTVTHINAESTSEFALAEANRFLAIACADAGVPGEQTGPFSGGDIGVCPLIVEAFVDSIHVIAIVFKANDGTLLDRTEIDGDGEVTEADILLPGPVPFDEDGGSVVLVSGFILDPGSPQFWIVVYKTSVAVTDGTSFRLEVFSAAAETAEPVSPVGVRAVVSSTFPVSGHLHGLSCGRYGYHRRLV